MHNPRLTSDFSTKFLQFLERSEIPYYIHNTKHLRFFIRWPGYRSPLIFSDWNVPPAPFDVKL